MVLSNYCYDASATHNSTTQKRKKKKKKINVYVSSEDLDKQQLLILTYIVVRFCSSDSKAGCFHLSWMRSLIRVFPVR